jgi:hypothetical protein
MEQNTVNGNSKYSRDDSRGYALLIAIIAVVIFSASLLVARALWETEIQRDLEQELIYRARHIVTGMEKYRKKNNKYAESLEELAEKKLIRKIYKDPMSESGKWNYVMESKRFGKKNLLIVPEELLPKYLKNNRVIGVCSSAIGESFLEYRKKRYYFEWAFYIGDNEKKEMPHLKFVSTI